jgi:diacylglycerol kinase family enzyme
MRVTLIHNEGAGSDRQTGAQHLRELIGRAGHTVSLRSIRDRDGANALRDPADLIAVAGGDGTIGRVARQMAPDSTPLAVLPMGTANNIAHTLGIADTPLEALIDTWPRGQVRELEMGVARGPWGYRRFMEGVGAGLFAWTMPQADASDTLASLTDADSKVTYAMQMLKDRLANCPAVRVRARLDGIDISGDYVLLEAMSTRYIGPHLYLAPHGDPADGQLDVVTVADHERDLLRDYIARWQNDENVRPALRSHRGRRLTLEWTGFHLHIDDDIWPDAGAMPSDAPAPIEIGIEPQALRMLVP